MNIFNMPSVITSTLSKTLGALAQKLSPGQQAIELAKSVAGQKAHDLKLANDTPIGKVMRDDTPDTTNCANFVSAVLVTAGQIPESAAHPHVTVLANNLKKQGWVEVDPKDAQPGDVVVLQHDHKDAHVELATGHDAKGTLTMIGSNNPVKGGAQVISENKVTGYWSGVKVLHNPNAKASGITSNKVGTPLPASAKAPAVGAVGSGFDAGKKKMVSLGRTHSRPAVARKTPDAPKPASDLEQEVAKLRAGAGQIMGAIAKKLAQPAPAAAPVAAPKTAAAGGVAAPKATQATAAAATTQSGGPAPKIAEAAVTSKVSHEYGPTPWEFNKWIPANGGTKSAKYLGWKEMRDAANSFTRASSHLETANKSKTTAEAEVKSAGTDPAKLKTANAHLDKATRAVEKATGEVETAKKSVDASSTRFKAYLTKQLPDIQKHDPQVRSLHAKQEKAETALAAENKKKSPDAAKVKTLQGEIDGAKADIATRKQTLAKEIADYQPIQHYDRTAYEVKVDGKKVTLYDSVQSYAAESKTGLSAHAADGGREGLEKAVDASKYSEADKLIMKQISRKEGVFSTTESNDRGGITWGMLQWTSGHDGRGSMVEVLNKVKTDHPEAFKKLFQDYGIDTSNGSLQVTQPDGKVLTGAEAVELVRSDPKLSTAFALAGTDTDVQATQMALAKSQKIDHDGLDRAGHVKVDGKDYKFTARQIFTSAYGAALVANAGVHGGPGEVMKRLNEGLKQFIADNPKLDLAHPEKWAAQAEKAMASVMIAGDGDRAKAFRDAGLSEVPGSYASSQAKS